MTAANAAKGESDSPPQGVQNSIGFADRRKSEQAAGQGRGRAWERIGELDDRRSVTCGCGEGWSYYEPVLCARDILTTDCDNDILYFSYIPDTTAYARRQTPPGGIEREHPRRREFGSLPNHLFNGIQEVPFCSYLPPGTYSEHPSLRDCVRMKY